MKCKICGKKTMGENALINMGKHYRKEHPGAMRAKKPRAPAESKFNPYSGVEQPVMKYCPTCGKPI